jgi:membrane-associated protein
MLAAFRLASSYERPPPGGRSSITFSRSDCGYATQVSHVVTHLVSGSPTTYGIVFAVVAVDAVLPFVQAEAVVITAGVLAAQGDLIIWLVVIAAAVGGFAGDNGSYLLGRRFGCRVVDRFFAKGRRKERLEQARRGVQHQGGLLIVVARFIPVGRTVTTLAAGTLELPWRRFAVADAIAATMWAIYAAMLGYAGGASFENSLWKPLALALGIAFLLGLVVEGYRRVQKRRGREVLSGEFR